jgi:hypothetical protein
MRDVGIMDNGTRSKKQQQMYNARTRAATYTNTK